MKANNRAVRASCVPFPASLSLTKYLDGKQEKDVLKRLFEQPFHSPADSGPCRASSAARGAISSGWPAQATPPSHIYSVREENLAFLDVSRGFRRHGLPVPRSTPKIWPTALTLKKSRLGDITLFEFLAEPGDAISPGSCAAYRKVVAELPRFQVVAGRDLDYKVCYPPLQLRPPVHRLDQTISTYYFLRLWCPIQRTGA